MSLAVFYPKTIIILVRPFLYLKIYQPSYSILKEKLYTSWKSITLFSFQKVILLRSNSDFYHGVCTVYLKENITFLLWLSKYLHFIPCPEMELTIMILNNFLFFIPSFLWIFSIPHYPVSLPRWNKCD